jgi:hypothetical protein
MLPLSRNKRRLYLIFFAIIFIIGTPFFIFNAKGYKLNLQDFFNVSKTGGLYISTDQSRIDISVNGEIVRKTSIIQKSIFVQNLKPGVYQINISKEGLQSWNKSLRVFPEIVTEARPFLIKSEPVLTEIPRLLIGDSSALSSTNRNVSKKNSEYDLINVLFLPPGLKSVSVKTATTSPYTKMLGDVLVKNSAGKLHVLWKGEKDSTPNYFCENACKLEIIVNTVSKVLSFDFFPGRNDLLILSVEDGIFVSEIDDRSSQNVQKVVSGFGYDFRIKDGKEIYLKKGLKIYSVTL